MNKNDKRACRRALGIMLSAMLIFSVVPMSGSDVSAAEKHSDFTVTDEELGEARRQFFEGPSFDGFSGDQEVVHIDDSDIMHKPQTFMAPEPPRLGRTAYPVTHAGPYALNDTRPFYVNDAKAGSAGYLEIQGKLVAQGDHVNIWVLDDDDFHAKTGSAHDSACHLKDIEATIASEITDAFDPIYKAMTDPSTGFATHAGIQIKAGFGNMPMLGDMGNDKKINFLLYDIDGDGGSAGAYMAGFFTNRDFFTHSSFPASTQNALDMLHIDIGDGQGYKVLTNGSEKEKLDFYGTMAHEFQHLLFYMYYKVYRPDSNYDSDSWINETLSALAEGFYTKAGKELVDFSGISSAAQNTYAAAGGYCDFLNHGSLKNYGMERLFAHVLQKRYPGIARNIYAHFESEYPLAQDAAGCAANTAKITSMQQAVGDFLKAGTGIGDGGQNTMALLYYIFMECFAADGGMIQGGIPVQTTKCFVGTDPPDNLWAIRLVSGVAGGMVFLDSSDMGGLGYNVSALEPIPEIASGGTVSLNGYGASNGKGASHEMLYKLQGGGDSEPYLTITAPSEANAETRYYVAVPKDELMTLAPHVCASGASGADVYPLIKGTPKTIDTNGSPAYLFVVTLYEDVSSSITYSWGAAGEQLAGSVSIDLNPATGLLTANTGSVTGGSGAFSYAWNGSGVSGTTDAGTYDASSNGLGSEIALTLTRADASGSLTAKIRPYKVTVTSSGGIGADSVSIASPYGKAGDGIAIAYTVGNTGTAGNSLTYGGAASGPAKVTSAGSGTSTYTIAAIDASNGVIALTATFGHEDIPDDKGEPGISGPTSLTLKKRYEATSTGQYTLTGAAPVSVTINNTQSGRILWNSATNRLDISAGLKTGTYTVVLTATNGISPDAKLTFNLYVTEPNEDELGGLRLTVPNFDEVTEGYSRVRAKAIRIRNTTDVEKEITEVKFKLSSSYDRFALEEGDYYVDENSSDTSWTIRPVSGLVAGTYKATIVVIYDDEESSVEGTVYFYVRDPGTNYYSSNVINNWGSFGSSSYSVMQSNIPAGTPVAASPSGNSLYVNNNKRDLPAYKIAGNNYLKLRDMAMLLSGTNKQFSVNYNEATRAIMISTGGSYWPVGNELQPIQSAGDVTATVSADRLIVNGQEVLVTAHNIGGFNYYRLRDIGILLNFGIQYINNGTVSLNLNESYVE